MTETSLWWIDWTLNGRTMRRESAVRLLLLFIAASGFLVMLLSGGVDRFLAGQWSVTALLAPSVSEEEGRGIAAKIADLPGVAAAEYHTPEAAWKEFIAAFPGLDSIRTASGNPLPGYVEIRLRRDRLTQETLGKLESALKPLPQIEKVLAGGTWMPRVLGLKRWVNAFLWSALGFLGLLLFTVFAVQERSRAVRLSGDFAFLVGRGIAPRGIAWRRAATAALVGGLSSLVALAAAAALLFRLDTRFSWFRKAVGPWEDLLTPALLPGPVLFCLLAALATGAASRMAWRAAVSPRP